MRDKKKLVGTILFVFFYFVIGAFSNDISLYVPFLNSTFIYLSLFLFWTASIKNRVVDISQRKKIYMMGIFMIGWILIRYIKYDVLFYDGINRFLWYLYYLPAILLPLFFFDVSCLLTTNEGYMVSERNGIKENNRKSQQNIKLEKSEVTSNYMQKGVIIRTCLYIMATALVVMFLTNDYHQMAFRFLGDFSAWDTDYTYGVIYYIYIIWNAILMGLGLLNLFRNNKFSISRKYIFIPLIPILIACIYFIFYKTLHNYYAIKFPEMFCYMIIGVLEGCIAGGVIQSNSYYRDYFNSIHFMAKILDKSGNTVFKSAYDFENFDEDNGDDYHKVCEHEIEGGTVKWLVNLEKIGRLKEELEETSSYLNEENELLNAENKMLQEKVALDEKNKIYELISQRTGKQMEEIKQLIYAIRYEGADYEQYMKQVCLRSIFIKRISNMILASRSSGDLSVNDLVLSIKELFHYLDSWGYSTTFINYADKYYDGQVLLRILTNIEEPIERYFNTVDTVRIVLDENERGLNLMLNIISRNGAQKTYKYRGSIRTGGSI